MTHLPIRLLSHLVLGFALAGSLSAATQTYTYTCDIDGNTTGGDVLPSFDTSLGTLTSVSLTNVMNANLSQTATNTGIASDYEFYTGALSNFVIEDASFTIYAATESYDTAYDQVHLGTGESFSQSYAGSPAPLYYGFHAFSNPNGVLAAPDDLARFSSGTALMVVNQALPDFEANPADSAATFTQDASGTLLATFTVTYTYQPVPEPASCAALGLGALALLRRRKAAS